MAQKPKSRRTTHRSRANNKLYAVRGRSGRFKDIQRYRKAHSRDIKRTTFAERVNRLDDAIGHVETFAKESGDWLVLARALQKRAASCRRKATKA